jgi:glutamine amidotransferase
MKPLVGIIDYGAGNLFSVENALNYISCPSLTSDNVEELRHVDMLILPGVGSFRDGMNNLKSLGFDEFICESVAHGKPLLGICLGMQLLFSVGYEGGETRGLGLIDGSVEALVPFSGAKIPHIGWNDVYGGKMSEMSIFSGVEERANFYFVHSFHALPSSGVPVAYTDFYGKDIVAAVQNQHVAGVQFHPEKSQKEGVRMLRNFTEGKSIRD